MNTQLNIKARRFFSPTFVTLLLGVVAVLVLGGPSIQAQTTTTATDSTAVDSTANRAPAPVTDPNAPVDSSLTIAAKGSFTDPTAGPISVNGSVIIAAKKVVDTTSTTAAALVMLDIDLSQLTGTSGSKTTLKTYVTGGNHASEIRPFQATDTIIVPVPYYESTKDVLSARTMLVSATLKFDTTTGKLTGATVSISNNVVTSTAVGTTAPVAIQ